jgi:hypothetical protein
MNSIHENNRVYRLGRAMLPFLDQRHDFRRYVRNERWRYVNAVQLFK